MTEQPSVFQRRWQLALTFAIALLAVPRTTHSQSWGGISDRVIFQPTAQCGNTLPRNSRHSQSDRSFAPAARAFTACLSQGITPAKKRDRFAGYYLQSCSEIIGRCANANPQDFEFLAGDLPFANRDFFALPLQMQRDSFLPEFESSSLRDPTDGENEDPSSSTTTEHEGFHWWPALQQSFNFLVFEHAVRIASDPYLRYLVWHKPFWRDYSISTKHFDFGRWGDGDDFLVNYIGHPLQGAVTGNIEIVNDPKGRSLTFGKSKAYWMSRLRAMAWSAAYSAQFEAGPMLSEAAIGSEGGYSYRKGCDPNITCEHPSNNPITNNTGWVDFVVTPAVGTGWIVMEDAIETEIVDRFAKGDDRLRWKLLRAGLSPGHVMANFMAGKVPWYRYRIDGPDGGSIFGRKYTERPKFSWENVERWELGGHYSFLSLPMDWEGCTKCRVDNSGFGINLAYRITNHLWFDSDTNFFPGSGKFGDKGHTIEGMYGPRYGFTGKSWSLYLKLRPGFVYYDKTLTADSGTDFTSATRFAFDVGPVFEWHTSRHSAIRIDAGTTVVRYLTGIVDPRQPQKSVISTDYIVSQSNFQIGTGYTYRF